jgi:hypothetical protein
LTGEGDVECRSRMLNKTFIEFIGAKGAKSDIEIGFKQRIVFLSKF